MTPEDLCDLRFRMGMTADELAKLVGVSGGRTVRRWEAEERKIPGPVSILLCAMRDSQSVRDYFNISLAEPSKIRI